MLASLTPEEPIPIRRQVAAALTMAAIFGLAWLLVVKLYDGGMSKAAVMGLGISMANFVVSETRSRIMEPERKNRTGLNFIISAAFGAGFWYLLATL